MTAAPSRLRRVRPAPGVLRALRVLGAALLAGMAWIHLELWLQGYASIPIIGPAFLLDVLAGFGLAALLLVSPGRLLPAVAALGALTAAGTLAALLLSTTVGLFGFVESTDASYWWESFWVELAAVAVLTALVAVRQRRQS